MSQNITEPLHEGKSYIPSFTSDLDRNCRGKGGLSTLGRRKKREVYNWEDRNYTLGPTGSDKE